MQYEICCLLLTSCFVFDGFKSKMLLKTILCAAKESFNDYLRSRAIRQLLRSYGLHQKSTQLQTTEVGKMEEILHEMPKGKTHCLGKGNKSIDQNWFKIVE